MALHSRFRSEFDGRRWPFTGDPGASSTADGGLSTSDPGGSSTADGGLSRAIQEGVRRPTVAFHGRSRREFDGRRWPFTGDLRMDPTATVWPLLIVQFGQVASREKYRIRCSAKGLLAQHSALLIRPGGLNRALMVYCPRPSVAFSTARLNCPPAFLAGLRPSSNAHGAISLVRKVSFGQKSRTRPLKTPLLHGSPAGE